MVIYIGACMLEKAKKFPLSANNVALNLVITALYFISAKLGLDLAFEAAQVTVIWPPTGIALAAILLFGYRVVPAIALGAFLANLLVDEPVMVALGITFGNTLEALAGAWILKRVGFNNSMSHLRDVISLIIFSAVFSTTISATIGVTTLALSGLQPWESYIQLWRLWWLGDAAGAIIVAPLLLTWSRGWNDFKDWRNKTEIAILTLGLITACVIIFTTSIDNAAFIYMVFPFVFWAALSFMQRGVTIVTVVACAVAIWATLHGFGPFTRPTVEESLTLLQIFMGVISITGLFLSAAIAESRHTEEMLRDSEARLAKELQAMNDLHDYSLRLAAARNLQTALNEILESGISITKADFGNIQILNAEGTGLEIAVHRGFKHDFLEHFKFVSLEDASSVCGRAAQNNGRMIIEDVEKDAGFEQHRNIARSAGFRAVQSTPLISTNGILLGMLSTHFRTPTIPSTQSLRMLDLYILQAAALIERLRTEEALRKAYQRKDDFLATLCHELRNPLAPIVSAARILQMPGISAPRRDEAQDIISRQAEHMTRLVDELLDVSRIAHGKIELRKQRMLLSEAIISAVEITRPFMESQGHKFTIELPPEPIWLDADPTRISQILTNLLGNAAKYTPRGGQIWLEVKADDNTVLVYVRDTGIGIPKTMTYKIFEPFMQMDASIERAHGGLGIGLALVKNLIAMHGGDVKVMSDGDGQGSEFIVRLPRAAPPKFITDTTPAPQVESPQSYRILVVDDNETLAKTFSWMLESLGHEVRFVNDWESAIITAQEFLPDVLMLDIGLPKVNGYELCQKLRAIPVLKNSIFIAQTVWGQAEHRARSKAAGFDYHLVKPVDLATLEQLFISLNIKKAS